MGTLNRLQIPCKDGHGNTFYQPHPKIISMHHYRYIADFTLYDLVI